MNFFIYFIFLFINIYSLIKLEKIDKTLIKTKNVFDKIIKFDKNFVLNSNKELFSENEINHFSKNIFYTTDNKFQDLILLNIDFCINSSSQISKNINLSPTNENIFIYENLIKMIFKINNNYKIFYKNLNSNNIEQFNILNEQISEIYNDFYFIKDNINKYQENLNIIFKNEIINNQYKIFTENEINIINIHNIFKNLNDYKNIFNINNIEFILNKIKFFKKTIYFYKEYYPDILNRPFINVIILNFNLEFK